MHVLLNGKRKNRGFLISLPHLVNLLSSAIQALNQKRNSQFWRNLNLKCVHSFNTAGTVISASALINSDQ